MLFAPKDQLQIVTNFEAIIGIKILIQPIIGVIFVLCKDVKKTQMGPIFFCIAVHTKVPILKECHFWDVEHFWTLFVFIFGRDCCIQ